MAGASDVPLRVAVRDPEHLRERASSAFTVRAEVAPVEMARIFEQVRSAELPLCSDAGADGPDLAPVARDGRASNRGSTRLV